MRTCALLGLACGLAPRLAILLAIGLAAALPGEAAAQTIAQPDARPGTGAESRPDPHPPAGLGGALTIGRAGMSGTPTGWLVRLDYEAFPILAPRGIAGPILGFHVGWEFWRATPGRDRGLALPMAVVLGVRAQPVRATLGVGVDALIVDEVNDDTGVGLYAPFACARGGGDIFGIQLGADARITRRWQIGAPDHTQWQLGVFAGVTWESKHRGPRY
ncbi:MAG TPA: hypothetical protein VNO30_05160 [Kofleriaceae bacterium]|nr:hypothetical protein [Kofleriaceae bacterium]